jgi:hypothetical protein
MSTAARYLKRYPHARGSTILQKERAKTAELDMDNRNRAAGKAKRSFFGRMLALALGE